MGKSKTKKVMTITRERALKLFEYFKYKTAGKWSSKRMEGKLANLPEMADIEKIKNDKVKDILEEIANASGIQVSSSKEKPKKGAQEKETKPIEEKETTEEKKTEKKKGGKRFGKKKEKASVEKSKADVDRWGRRKGTQGALINECISKKPKTLETICKETKLSKGRVNVHIKAMIENGFVKETKDGEYCEV